MEPIEYDVYLGYREPSGADLAKVVFDGLARRRFRVLPLRTQAAGAAFGSEAGSVEDIPDFVLLLTPNCLDASADRHDAMRAEIAHALETQKNIVPVVVRGYEHPQTLPPDLVRLRARPVVTFSQARTDESIARIAHRPGELHVAPADGGWWSFDQGAGADRIYVIASYDPVENLESLADEREESTIEARQSLLDSTIGGLLDGKHGSTGGRLYTRRGRLIRRGLEAAPALLTASATLGSGATITHTLTAEQGLLSATAEIRVGAAR